MGEYLLYPYEYTVGMNTVDISKINFTFSIYEVNEVLGVRVTFSRSQNPSLSPLNS